VNANKEVCPVAKGYVCPLLEWHKAVIPSGENNPEPSILLKELCQFKHYGKVYIFFLYPFKAYCTRVVSAVSRIQNHHPLLGDYLSFTLFGDHLFPFPFNLLIAYNL
jgi:hypothetical protein